MHANPPGDAFQDDLLGRSTGCGLARLNGRHFVRSRARDSTEDRSGLLSDQLGTIVQNDCTSTVIWDPDEVVSWNGNSPGKRTAASFLVPPRILEEASDARGRIASASHGSGGAGDRVTSFACHPTKGRLSATVDPSGPATSFERSDAARRILPMKLPGKLVGVSAQDAEGEVTSFTAPGRAGPEAALSRVATTAALQGRGASAAHGFAA